MDFVSGGPADTAQLVNTCGRTWENRRRIRYRESLRSLALIQFELAQVCQCYYFRGMRFLLPLFFLGFFLVSCSDSPADSAPVVGYFDGRTFLHDELDLQWSIPESWRIVSEEELRERQAISADELRSKISDIGTRKSVFRPFLALEPYASEDSSYVTILLMTEKLENVPGINNPYDYFNQNAAVLQSQDPQAYPRYEFSEIKNVQFAGKPALRQGAMIHPNADEIQPMENVVLRRGDFLLVVQIANFDSVEELNQAHTLLDEINWTGP